MRLFADHLPVAIGLGARLRCFLSGLAYRLATPAVKDLAYRARKNYFSEAQSESVFPLCCPVRRIAIVPLACFRDKRQAAKQDGRRLHLAALVTKR